MYKAKKLSGELSRFDIRWLTRTVFVAALLSIQWVYAADQKAVAVEVKPISKLAFFPTHRASATVESLNESRLSAQITAVVEEIPVKVGQVADKDRVLVRLDCTDYELILQREQAMARSIEARLDLALYQLQRAQKLTTQQAVAEELLKQRETDVAVLKAEQANQRAAIEQAKRNVGYCVIRSPYNAIILERIGQVGELAAPGAHLLRILDASQREVSAKLQQQQISSLQDATDIAFEMRGEQYLLRLRSITPSIDTRERTREVRLEFQSNKTGAMALPGSAGEISWQTRQPHLPSDLIVRRNNQLGVFVVRNDVAEFYAIPSATEGRPARIDLKADEQVVTKGRYRLQPGDAVVLQAKEE